MEHLSHSEQETEQLGEQVARKLPRGTVIAYTGELGMGKTAFTRGLAREGRTVGFSTVLPDRPRALAGLLGIVSELGANVLEVSHERSSLKADLGSTVVHLLVETRNRAHVDELFDALHREGYQLIQR